MEEIKVGVIGGSGVYSIEGLTDTEIIHVDTPFGETSDHMMVGALENTRVVFLPRHKAGHRISPAELPSRANIYAMKTLGVERIISISAVGSLRQDLAPLDIVIPDQLFDRTNGRPSTFFGHGMVVHIGFADPFCPQLSQVLYEAAQHTGRTVHKGGAIVVINGPQFSTKAESNTYRRWGMDLVGMTALPEAKLAREAEICYATVAMVTDYDVWHPDHASVTVEMVVKNLLQNAAAGKTIVRDAVKNMPAERECTCGSALQDAIITSREKIPAPLIRDLAPIVGRYMGEGTA